MLHVSCCTLVLLLSKGLRKRGEVCWSSSDDTIPKWWHRISLLGLLLRAEADVSADGLWSSCPTIRLDKGELRGSHAAYRAGLPRCFALNRTLTFDGRFARIDSQRIAWGFLNWTPFFLRIAFRGAGTLWDDSLESLQHYENSFFVSEKAGPVGL